MEIMDNPDYANLPEIRQGDYILLEKKDWVPYILEAFVTNVDQVTGSYTCKITNIFDKQTSAPVTGGDPLGLLNTNITVSRRQIQKKIERGV